MGKNISVILPGIILFAISLTIIAGASQAHWFNSSNIERFVYDPFLILSTISPIIAFKCFSTLLAIVALFIITSIITNFLFGFTCNKFSGIEISTSIAIFAYLAFSLLSSDILLFWIFSEGYLINLKLALATTLSGLLAVIITFYLIFNIGLVSSIAVTSKSTVIQFLHFTGLLATTAFILSIIFKLFSQKSLEILF